MLGQSMAPNKELSTEDHTHDSAPSGHDHDAEYSGIAHNHDADYAADDHTHAELHTHAPNEPSDGGGELGSAYVKLLDPFTFGGTTFVDMPGLVKTVNVGDRPVMIHFETLIESTNLGDCLPTFQLLVENNFLEELVGTTITQQNGFVNIARSVRHSPANGEYTYKMTVRTDNGQAARLPTGSVHLLRITEV